MSERDKFLTEAMGECWHEGHNNYGEVYCLKCKKEVFVPDDMPDFSTWDGFGKLWDYVESQHWCREFIKTVGDWQDDEPAAGLTQCSWIDTYLVNPDRFADALYEFLRSRS